MKNIKELLQNLDETLLFGDFVLAAETHFDDSVKTIYGKTVLKGKPQRLETLRAFTSHLEKINGIKLFNQSVKEDETYSLFNFDFSLINGQQVVWYEIIRRKWKGGKVVEEEYLVQPDEKKIFKIFSGKEVRVDQAALPEKVTAGAGADKLTSISGIGPKVAEVLGQHGIHTFADLAKANQDDLRLWLKAVNFRFQSFDPAPWLAEAAKKAKI